MVSNGERAGGDAEQSTTRESPVFAHSPEDTHVGRDCMLVVERVSRVGRVVVESKIQPTQALMVSSASVAWRARLN